MKPFYLAITLPLLAACAASVGNTPAHPVKIIKEADSAPCAFLGDVHGTSPGYGVFAGSALEAARTAALDKAAALGANAVAWSGNETGYGSTTMHGNAYRCP